LYSAFYLHDGLGNRPLLYRASGILCSFVPAGAYTHCYNFMQFNAQHIFVNHNDENISCLEHWLFNQLLAPLMVSHVLFRYMSSETEYFRINPLSLLPHVVHMDASNIPVRGIVSYVAQIRL